MLMANRYKWEKAMATKITSRPFIRCVLACALPLLIFILPTLAMSDDTVTVCPVGPPQCDYNAIQPAIKATGSGATILIGAGTYTGQIILRSDVTLIGSAGPTNTIVTALASPIVSGSNIVSVTLQGLAIQGQGISTSLGIDLFDSSIVLSNVVVSNLHGTQGITDQPHGGSAVAIRLTGTLQVLLINSLLQDITGGDGFVDFASNTGAAGGDAAGVQAHGAGMLNISDTLIQRLQGGRAGDPYFLSSTGCTFASGAASAIEALGQFSLTVNAVHAINVTGGWPCHVGSAHCPALAGPANGVRAEGGTAILIDNRFENLTIWPANGSEPAAAIRTANTTTTLVARNVITRLSVLDAWLLQQASRPESPYCWPMPGSVVGIASINDHDVRVSNNLLNTLWARGVGGYATGITVQASRIAELTQNTIISVIGGSASHTTGIQIGQSNEAFVEANRLEHIQGSGTPSFGYNWNAVNGGDAVGIELRDVNATTVENNTVWSVTGGDGNPTIPAFVGGNGGNATGLLVSQGMASVWNNVFAQTRPGAAGTTLSITGTAVGLHVEGAEVRAINNVLIDHGNGLSATAPSNVLAGYNDLWSNGVDYRGVPPGLGDLHANPWFVDAEHGDFHLSFVSPLIDAGLTLGAPSVDFDGDSRPYDGDGDGQSRTDIGADEFRPGTLNKVYLPSLWVMSQ
jgi:hypothetical protein